MALISHDAYLENVKDALLSALCLVDLPSQEWDRCALVLRKWGQHRALSACGAARMSRPEVEWQDSPELVLEPVTISRTALQQCLIEPSINSVRLSVRVSASLHTNQGAAAVQTPSGMLQAQQEDAVGQWLLERLFAFLAKPACAEQLLIVRKRPCPGYHLSFLITAAHCQAHSPVRLVEAVCQLLEGLPAAFGFRLALSSQSRAVGHGYLKGFVARPAVVAAARQ